MMYFLFNIAILQMAYQYKVNEVEFFGNFLVFYFWFCFALMLLASVCINACRKNGTIRKPHFKNVAESQLPFGEEGFIGFELAVSCLLAGFGLFNFAVLNILTAILQSANIKNSRKN